MGEEIKQELKLGDAESSTYALLNQLADGDTDITINVDSNEVISKTKMFLVLSAQKQLKRILKQTAFLEKLESKFMESIDEVLDSESDSIRKIAMISQAMETLSKCIEDANNFVFQVLKDDKFSNITINTTNIITPDGNSATIIDADSRDEVRNLAASLLEQLSKMAVAESADKSEQE